MRPLSQQLYTNTSPVAQQRTTSTRSPIETPAQELATEAFVRRELMDSEATSTLERAAQNLRVEKDPNSCLLQAAEDGQLKVFGIPGLAGATLSFISNNGSLQAKVGNQITSAHSSGAYDMATTLPDGRSVDLKQDYDGLKVTVRDKGTLEQAQEHKNQHSSVTARFRHTFEPNADPEDYRLSWRDTAPNQVTLISDLGVKSWAKLETTAGQVTEFSVYSPDGTSSLRGFSDGEVVTRAEHPLPDLKQIQQGMLKSLSDSWLDPKNTWQSGYRL